MNTQNESVPALTAQTVPDSSSSSECWVQSACVLQATLDRKVLPTSANYFCLVDFTPTASAAFISVSNFLLSASIRFAMESTDSVLTIP